MSAADSGCSAPVNIYIYIYVYTHMHICISIYIYIYIYTDDYVLYTVYTYSYIKYLIHTSHDASAFRNRFDLKRRNAAVRRITGRAPPRHPPQ